MERIENPYEMNEEQRRALVDHLLFLYGTRTDLKRKRVSWEELPGKSTQLAAYSPQVLRFYTRACAYLGMLKDFDDRETFFTVGGLTRAGDERTGAKSRSAARFAALLVGYSVGRFLPRLLVDRLYGG